MAKLVDAQGLKPCLLGGSGSSPDLGIMYVSALFYFFHEEGVRFMLTCHWESGNYAYFISELGYAIVIILYIVTPLIVREWPPYGKFLCKCMWLFEAYTSMDKYAEFLYYTDLPYIVSVQLFDVIPIHVIFLCCLSLYLLRFITAYIITRYFNKWK